MCHDNHRHHPKTYLTIEEVATYCGVSTKTLRRAVRSHRLAHYQPVRAYLFEVADLDAYMNASRFGVVVFGAVLERARICPAS